MKIIQFLCALAWFGLAIASGLKGDSVVMLLYLVLTYAQVILIKLDEKK